ncbi:MAG: zinc ABC transporter substrate-binding protein [Acidimicrobiales bacterium]
MAAENFWGSLAAQLAGRLGTVTTILADPTVDPHGYETRAADARAFASADYVITNGAGYDAWADRLLAGNRRPGRKVLTVATLLGKSPRDNPHFWYDPTAVDAVVAQMSTDLLSIDPAEASYLTSQRTALDNAFAPMRHRLADIKATHPRTQVASTESIFVYLGRFLGLDVISPPDFMSAVAEGNDPPAPAVALFEQQLTSHAAKVFVYNRQTSTAATSNLERAARRLGIPTVALTETIVPSKATFEEWFTTELGDLQVALDSGRLVPTVPDQH